MSEQKPIPGGTMTLAAVPSAETLLGAIHLGLREGAAPEARREGGKALILLADLVDAAEALAESIPCSCSFPQPIQPDDRCRPCRMFARISGN